MFKRIRAKLPDWRFIAFVVSNSIPGKKLLGDWRFTPIFFVAGCCFELVLCKLRINNINFSHTWLNPMKDYKDFITKAEAEYQAHQEELREVEDYLDKKREQRLKQIT
ncbi:unnamed protein product [Rotaria magnacalcarata]|uniref:Uncharacterized protein n=1 Tax=Rotaria magnacalcarata TaxID=392030 RepID=A0A818Z4N5_9BILA|nr:unnamed protein product [Rotaria magnacalcarata]CAF3793223.1 unnamed protein product [Rotaria magnacalcarata]CAF3965873.1 unnamed protein product [Rotaria magnacalcarata]CAF4098210.1 unnamed protein product [Rotaria magnacalcarata]CAF4181140.1 unnamed protein product [Rotaria magnacalcarata]